MDTITLPKTDYNILRKKAFLYEEVFKLSPDNILDTEDYSEERLKEFMVQDKINKKTKSQIKKLLKTL